MTTTLRAAYFVTADGQGDVCLTSEDQAHLTDVELIEAAVAEAREHGLIGSVSSTSYDFEAGEDVATLTTEQDVRNGLRVGEYTR